VLLFLILLAALPIVVPIASFASLVNVRRRLAAAEELLEQQRRLLRDVERQLQRLGRETTDPRAHIAPSPAAAHDAAPTVPAKRHPRRRLRSRRHPEWGRPHKRRIAAFFGLIAEATWSAVHLTLDHVRAALQLYAAFAAFYLGVPLIARRLHRTLTPAWGSGAVLIASLLMLLYLASAPASSAGLWGLALLLAILDSAIFIESAAVGPQVRGAPAVEVALDVERLQDGAAGPPATLVSPRLFWMALGIAACVLVGLIVRLLKKPASCFCR
jgi:hypothetical protein